MGWSGDEIGRPTGSSVDVKMRIGGAAEQRSAEAGNHCGTEPWWREGLIVCGLLIATCLPGCVGGASPPGKPELVWGRQGLSPGRLMKPRAMAIDKQDQLYIVDITGRIQVFDAEGKYLRGWRTPESQNGKPTGCRSIGRAT